MHVRHGHGLGVWLGRAAGHLEAGKDCKFKEQGTPNKLIALPQAVRKQLSPGHSSLGGMRPAGHGRPSQCSAKGGRMTHYLSFRT